MVNESTKSCSFCGQNMEVDDTFCNNCGNSLTEPVDSESEKFISAVQKTDELISSKDQSVFVEEPREPRNIIAIVSLVLGIFAACFSFITYTCCVSIVLGVAAIITGLIGINNQKRRYYAIAGLGFTVIAAIMISLQYAGVFYFFP